MATAPSFLSYTPVALTFGTSGLRGLVTDITDLEAYVNVKGALRYLARIGDVRADGSVVLAGDLRPSTDRIMRACGSPPALYLRSKRESPSPLAVAAISRKAAKSMVRGYELAPQTMTLGRWASARLRTWS